MEFKKVIIDGKDFEFVSKVEDDEYEFNEINDDLDNTLDLGERIFNEEILEDTVEIKVVSDEK